MRPVDLTALTIGVVGGDEREAVIARLAAEDLATVRAHGFPMPEGGIPGVEACDRPDAAARDANFLLLPIPGIAADGTLFAPLAPAPIVPAPLLAQLAPGATVILGAADDALRERATELGVSLCEYEDDRMLMAERAPAVVEGAIAETIANTDVTIDASDVAVVGYGTIGSQLSATLDAMGARVHVAARRPEARESARSAGLGALKIGELPGLAPNLAMLFSTVPAPVVGADVLRSLPTGSLVMDLAAPPGGVDLDLARSLGLVAVWARGLGRRAPITVGRSQWGGIRARIEDLENRRARS